MDLAIESTTGLCLENVAAQSIFHSRLLNAVGQAIIAADADGVITFWNKAAEQFFGRSKNEMVGEDIKRFLLDFLPQLRSGVLDCLKSGETWKGEFGVKCGDSSYRAVIISCSPFFNDEGEFEGSIGVVTDITEQKWMQDALIETIQKIEDLNDKMRVVESLTRHDVRNKLTALTGRLFLLKGQNVGNDSILADLNEIGLISRQILRILEFEQVYVQVGSEELIEVNVEKSVEEAANLFTSLKEAKLTNNCHGLTVTADSLLRQIFYNLIDNTLKYGEVVTEIKVYFEQEPNQLRLVYQDNGVGIPNDAQQMLFTEGHGKGTGYGLFLIKRICDAYGWAIDENGTIGKGARFVMTIPKVSQEGKAGYQININ
jgi:PAS domain S-box-containing protein